MKFKQRHPYLFWQIIGWGIFLADFAFLVVAALNNFGEWQYPVIVFTFMAALFAVAVSPFIVRFTRKRNVPQNQSAYTEKIIRSKISAINFARKKGHEGAAAFLAVFLVIFFFFAAYILGEHVHLALGFAAMVLAMIAPFVIISAYYTRTTKKFFTVKNGEKLIDMFHADDLKQLYETNPRVLIVSGEPTPVLLNFIYNWLKFYLKSERLTLYRIPAPELCGVFTPANFLAYENILFCILEDQFDLTKETGELFRKECDIMFAIPFSFCAAEESGERGGIDE